MSAVPSRSGAPPKSGAPLEFDDVQGLLRFAFKHLTEASFLLLRIKDQVAARAWLAEAPVTDAVLLQTPPERALQVAFTHDGLRALGLPAEVAGEFAKEFVAGMAGDANRARRLGDVGPNDSSHWAWGVDARVPHAVVLLYAAPGQLQEWQRAIEAGCAAGFELLTRLSTTDMGGNEPFGFKDGISQPQPDWSRALPVLDKTHYAYTNESCLGEYLLGYPNEYALYTPRPLLDPQADAGGMLPPAEEVPDKRDLGRNGSYLVLRQLRQDVHGFWQALDRYANGQPDVRARLAEAMVGRTLEGEPLVGLLHEAIAGIDAEPVSDLNAFTYGSDPRGVRCPLGAHIRRTNPRSADLPLGEGGLLSRALRMLGLNATARRQDLVASTRFHRLLRRGREYGKRVPLAEALSTPPSAASSESGLHFICLGASIERQFEFVQNAWVVNAKFDGLDDEGDPLLGCRAPGPGGSRSDSFRLPQTDGPDRRLTDLPPFVNVVGGAYFFLPGIRALRYLAGGRSGGAHSRGGV